MKQLISERFSIANAKDVTHLSSTQLRYRDMVIDKLKNTFTLISNPCPCGSRGSNDTIVSEIDRYGLPLNSVLCASCGTIRIDPYLDNQSLADFYTHYYQEMYGRSADIDHYFKRQNAYGKKFLAISNTFLKPKSNVFEFGCGAGGALKMFQDAGHQVWGIEYSPKLIEFGHTRGLSNLRYGSIEDFASTVGDVKFDLIFSNHVFEHVMNPVPYMQTCLKMLKDEGRIICAVPDIYNSHRYPFPNSDLRMMLHIAHIYNYTFECLQAMAQQLNVSIERIFPDERIITATSEMPELWFEIRKATRAVDPSSPANKTNYFSYLYKTDENFRLGKNLLDTRRPLTFRIKNKIKKLLAWKK
jgi:SAM-dependent methyltransferase